MLDMNSAVDRDQYLQLKFSQFKKFYAINPSSYKLHDYVASKGGICVIKFNLIDTLKFIHFKEQIEKNKANARIDNRMHTCSNHIYHIYISIWNNARCQQRC